MIALCNRLLKKVTMVEVLKLHQESAEHSWNKLHKWLTQLWDCTASSFWLGVKIVSSQLNNKCLKIQCHFLYRESRTNFLLHQHVFLIIKCL